MLLKKANEISRVTSEKNQLPQSAKEKKCTNINKLFKSPKEFINFANIGIS